MLFPSHDPANFRLMYDKRSELQTNNAFVTGLRRAERTALQISSEADSELVKQHEKLVTKLNGIRDQANADLKASAEQTKAFLIRSRQEAVAGMMRKMHTPLKSKSLEDFMGMGDTSQFKQTLKRIEGELSGFHARMASMGLMTGEGTFEDEFLDMDRGSRIAVIKELRAEVESPDRDWETRQFTFDTF